MTNGADLVKLALLIDGDNVSASYMPLIEREAAKLGTLAVRRIYGQFDSGRMKTWLKHLDEYDLTPVNVSPLTRGKNATDLKLTIEAVDILHGRGLDGFCIASSDGDFTPLTERIRAAAVSCYGFGMKKAPAGYKAAFDRFFECDTLLAAEKKTAPRSRGGSDKVPAPAKAAPRQPAAPKAGPAARAPRRTEPQTVPQRVEPQAAPPRRAAPAATRLAIPTDEILAAIEAVRGSDGWSHLGSVSNQVYRAIENFSPKKYGYSTLKRLVASMPEVESHTTPNGTAFVRRR